MAWTCVKCHTKHATRNKLRCDAVINGKVCGRKQPKKAAKPAHLAVLDQLTYADFVEINGGDFCWICRFLEETFGVEPVAYTRLYRDHDHKTGNPRGLLCFHHNNRLVGNRTLEEVSAVKAYLERTEVSL